MSEPLVSCLCATYGRPQLLGEAIKCFIDQDYSNKELIVLNDQVGVELFIENCPDNIRVYNHPTRFNSLGEKRNYLKSLGKGDFFCVWDDDDLYTPWRISESLGFMLKDQTHDIIKAKDAFMSTNNANYKVANNLFHSQGIITKKYMNSHQYPPISGPEDMEFEKAAKVGSVDIFPSFWYVYRWGNCGMPTGVHHVSGIADSKQSWDRSLTYPTYQITGKIEVKPEFKRDYWADIHGVLCKMCPVFGKL